jgi:NAD(P)-dependent dehydrogenase (short-subunit alcohol dehydrogenase family)
MRLDDRVVIITGAGSGIGSAMAEKFLEAGARVIAADVLDERLAQFYQRPSVTAVRADVTSQADVDVLVSTAERLGRLDVVCNNAGIVDRFLPAGEMTDDVWNRVLDVNLTGPMRLARAAIPLMLRAGRGVIINTASVAGLAGGRAGAAYTASKHGLIGLTRNIAATYGRDGIRCVAIAPGAVNTGISSGGEPSQRGYATLSSTLSTNIRTAEPVEIANIAVFLSSDEASFINGTVLAADGGWLAA